MKGGEDMTDRQMQFLTWLITNATDRCTDMEDVRRTNAEIRRQAKGVFKLDRKEEENKETDEE